MHWFYLGSNADGTSAVCNVIELAGTSTHAVCNVIDRQVRQHVDAVCNVIDRQKLAGTSTRAVCNVSTADDKELSI